MDSSNSRRLYEGQSIQQNTSEVFRTEEPETCVLVVNSTQGTLLCLIEAGDADRVAAMQWTTDEHLDDIYIRHANGWIESLSSFIAGQTNTTSSHHETTDITASADTSYEPRLLYDREQAARQLSISVRSLDYLIANRKLDTRRIGKKVLIPYTELKRFAQSNHYDSVVAP